MSGTTNTIHLHSLSGEESPGRSEYLRRWWQDETVLRPAGAALHREAPHHRSGPGWKDERYQSELLAHHQELAASSLSLKNLESLGAGAACVITGQQPAILGGPLYCAWKIAGAVGLARELSARSGQTVVPVFWCGSDDSDFEEARQVWIRPATGGPWQSSLPRGLVEPGRMVGSVSGPPLIAIEDSLREMLGEEIHPELAAWLDSLPAEWELGDRVMSAFLRLFASDGLVVVDARSARLRELGRPLFERYHAERARIAEAVDARGDELEQEGLDRALHPSATQSGLFRIESERRLKLSPSELDAGLETGWDLSASVLLRPLLQDELFAPVATVLGPSELHYHAQLAPAYSMLEVIPAAPAPRPHLTLLPPGVELPSTEEGRRLLLAGGEGAREVLGRWGMPPAWMEATERLRSELDESLGRVRDALKEAGLQSEVLSLEKALQRTVEELRGRLLPHALSRQSAKHPELEYAPAWLAVRGIPQERAYASWLGWLWLGQGFSACLRELGDAYATDLLEGRASYYCASLGESRA